LSPEDDTALLISALNSAMTSYGAEINRGQRHQPRHLTCALNLPEVREASTGSERWHSGTRLATAGARPLPMPGYAANRLRRRTSADSAVRPAPTRPTARRRARRFHDLRHFYASTLIAANLNPKVIQARLGHATITETMDTYGHLFPDAEDFGRGAIDAVFAVALREHGRNQDVR
jgi:integrase